MLMMYKIDHQKNDSTVPFEAKFSTDDKLSTNLSSRAIFTMVFLTISLLVLPLVLPPLPPPPLMLLFVPVLLMALLVFLAFTPSQLPNVAIT